MRRSLVVLLASLTVGCGPAASSSGSSSSASGGGEQPICYPGEQSEGCEDAGPAAAPEVLEAEGVIAEGRPQQAEAALETYVASHPDDTRAWLDIGLAREMQDDVAGAEEAYRRTLAIDATFAEGLNNLGVVLRDGERLDEAIELFQRALASRPGFGSARLNLALAYEDAGRDADAEREYRQVVRNHPAEPSAQTNLGLLLLRRGQRDEALVVLRRAASAAAGSRAELAAIGAGLRRAGDASMASRVLQQAIDAEETPPTPGLRSELALALFAADQRPRAEQLLRAIIGDTSDFALAHYLLANMLAAREAWADAATEYQAYLRAAPSGEQAGDARQRLEYVRTR